MSADADVYDSVQWYKDGVAIVGATSTTFTKGNVTLADAGKYKAVFTGEYGTIDTRDATVTVNTVPEVPVTKVELDKATAELDIDGTVTLKATVTPANATDKKVTWKSSKTAVAKVSTTGVVTALIAGDTTITATAKGGASASCEVNVKPNP